MKPETKKSQTYAKKSLYRLGQLLSYLNLNWRQTQHRIQSKVPIMLNNLKNHNKLSKEAFIESRRPDRRFQIPQTKQKQKLRQVNSILGQIDTNLLQVIQGIELIYKKLNQYRDIQAIHNALLRQNHNQNTHDNHTQQFIEYYDKQVFQNCFKYIYENFFFQSFQEIMSKSSKKLAIWLLSIQTKLSVLPPLVDSASKFKADITCCKPFYQKYSYAWKKIQVKQFDTNFKETITNQINILKRMMKITTSAVVTQNSSTKTQLFKKIVFGLSFPIFLLADQESELRCYKMWRKPSVQNLNLVWNMPQNGAIKQCKKMMLASIRTNFFIYIPTYLRHDSTSSFTTKQQIKPQIFSKPNHQQYVRVLVLYSNKLRFAEQQKKNQPFTFLSCWDVHEQIDLDTIIIHMHGGGFVALSSQSAQSYTRIWANKVKVPIFSIDYRKPPNFRFPVALQDCFAAYKFIVEKIHQYFNVRPTNIILTGDSAGGNLAVALQGLLMLQRYPILPKGLFLAYPAVDLRIKFSPSRMYSFQDPILLPPLLLLCLKQYLGENSKNEENPLASPILLSQYFIQTGKGIQLSDRCKQSYWPRNWPTTRIVVGKKDPLYDDSLRLLERMARSDVDVKLKIYNEFSHAFLSMDLLVPACRQSIQDSINELLYLLSL